MNRAHLLAISFVALIAAAGCGSPAPQPGSDAGSADASTAEDSGSQADAGTQDDGGGVDGGGVDSGVPDAGSSDAGTLPCDIGAPTDALTVATDKGLVRGVDEGQGLTSFRGIPFAEPPVGANRFRPPQPAACWSGVKSANAYGSRCFQKNLTGRFEGSEDCLFLNVWTPELPKSGAAAKPVLVWIHGGVNVIGSANEPLGTGNLYDGENLARDRDVVVVSLNYRLGPLGFLAHPELTAEGEPESSGNYAALDQIAALQWVKKNIAAFGGDPARVMIFGESAGALNTCVLVTSPLAAGLFSSALMQSGECSGRTLSQAETRGQEFSTEAGCTGSNVAACLRGLAPSALFNVATPASDALKGWDLPWSTNVDGWVLKSSPLEAITLGQHNKVPFVVGSNADESELFLPFGSINTCAQYEAMVGQQLPALRTQVLAQYPCSAFTFPRWAAVAVMTDLNFTCAARRIARAMSTSQTQPVYRYFYTHTRAYGPTAGLRAFHAAEIPFIFDTFANQSYVPTSEEAALSTSLQRYWSALARNGNPNDPAELQWLAYELTREQTMVLETPKAIVQGVRDEKCDFWDAHTTQ